jgi:hypothetical protein
VGDPSQAYIKAQIVVARKWLQKEMLNF